MRIFSFIFKLSVAFLIFCSPLFSADFTIASYNCGGISNHYDYIRAISMHKLTRERFNAEAERMAQLEKIENAALKILFADEIEKQKAEQEWELGSYSDLFNSITDSPDHIGSINRVWKEKSDQMVTPYNVRPVIIYDEEMNQILKEHITDLTRGQEIKLNPEDSLNKGLDITRRVMAERIFRHELTYDIIALQEADYLDASLFADEYDVRFSSSDHSVNGVAWNKKRFDLVEVIGDVEGRGLIVLLRDLESGEKVSIASGHLTGCNPFCSAAKADSKTGDSELQKIIDRLDQTDAKIKIIAMDSNVTATHPRLSLLKRADYRLDCTNYLEPTCTNPTQILNTRIDWIALKSSDPCATISNIPILGVGLNSPETNMSDHKPIAARVSCS